MVIVAVVTLLWGAIIGCAKDDIKKALAGSTMSQIGYMMLGAGLGVAGYAFAIFHLLTHGFFKANMFLGAGSVMHAMDDDVDMRHYGALRKMLPVTFLTFAMGYLAIIGFPGFSGFWSKDKIIETAFTENVWVGLAALLGAGITAFYMTRLMLMTFFTDKRWEPDVHPHESPKVMTIPLIVLAALSVLGGFLLLGDWIVDFLGPVVGEHAHEDPPIPALAAHPDHRRGGGRRRGAGLVPGRQARGAARGARRTSPSSPGRRAPTSTATRSTTAWSSSPDAAWSAGCSPSTGRAPTGCSSAAAPRSVPSAPSCGGPRTASSAPTPCPCSAGSSSSSWRCWR